jgi:aspartate 1-decarboxylase
MTYGQINDSEIKSLKPTVILLDDNNKILS